MRPVPSRPRRPVRPSAPVACAASAVVLALGVPAAHAAPAVSVAPGAAGEPALAAWVSGTTIRVGTAGGATRTVARLRSARTAARLTLDRKGRRIAIGTSDGLRVLDLVAGGATVRLTGDDGVHQLVSWSPDGRELLVASQGDVLRCTPGVATPCRRVATGAESDGPPTWSPDGAAFAYVTERATRAASMPSGVVVVTGGTRRRLETVRSSDRTLVAVSPPVWAAGGPLWSTVELRLPRATAADRGSDERDRATQGSSDGYLLTGDLRVRYRLRASGADGRVRTLAAGDQASGRPIPPVPLADGPSGPIGMSYEGRFGAPRVTYRVGRIAPDGGFAPIWTVRVRTTSSGNVADDAMVAGVLADGTVVMRRGTLPSTSYDERLPLTELRALDGPTGPGRLLARGRSATLAAPYPSSVLDLE